MFRVKASATVECICPVPRRMTETAAPKAPAFDMPSVNGDPSGFLRIDCMATPATESPIPATIAASACGRRMFQTIRSVVESSSAGIAVE